MKLDLLIFTLLAAMIPACAFAADKDKAAYLDAKSAGPDFAVQGEYEGTIGTAAKVGAQVVALGDGKFDAVLYTGGLPGAGWDGKTRVFLKGETKKGETTLTGKNFTGEIKDDTFSGTAEDNVAFSLKKVERKSETLGAEPPAGALVLFDGTNVDAWDNAKVEDEKLLGVGPADGHGVATKQKFRDFTLHLEFRTPFMPTARGQGRGNSGMYLGSQYECQILDSFGLEGADNECGGLYKVAKPDVNMCLPPLAWQTYDVEFKAARFDEAGKKTEDAIATIKHNGVVIHENRHLVVTPGGGQNDEMPGPIFLQNHGNPVRFRNIWIIEK